MKAELQSLFKRFVGPKALDNKDFKRNQAVVTLESPTPENSGYPGEMVAFVLNQFNEGGFVKRQDDVRVCASELITNAIIHGNNLDPSKHIRVSCLWRSSTFYFTVADDGQGFDVNNPPFVLGKSGMPPEGGMGINSVKQRSDLLYNIDKSTVCCAIRV